MFPLKPLECYFSSMVIVLLEGEPPSQSKISGRLKQNVPVFRSVHHSFNSDQFPIPCRWKTSPQHDAAITMLHCGDGILGVMRGLGFATDIVFSLLAKKQHFSLIWPEHLLPYVWGVSTCILVNTKCVCLFFSLRNCFFSGHFSLKPSSVECTA